MAAGSGSGQLDCDRYGVPQYAGQPELFEEYQERCWDLFHSREGQDHLQVATPLHLRANLSGAASEAVRKLNHEDLRTKDPEGKASDKGLKLFLQTLKDNIAVEQPVRLNELFLKCFYSPQVWRGSTETMAQYIVRREQDFVRLKEASEQTQVSENVRCLLLLLLFSGLDGREQQAVLASVGNEYDFKKVAHALRIQYPNAIPRPVMRRDFLGAGRTGAASIQSKMRFKGSHKIKQVLAVDDADENDIAPEDDEVYVEGDFAEDEDESEGAYVAYSDDEALDSLLQEIPWDNPEESSLAEAYATVAQHRMQKRNQVSSKKSSSVSSTMTVPFKAHGDFSFDQRAKDQRAKATNFLKSVTQCTACFQRGHWVGDPECPKSGKKGKGKASPKRRPGVNHSPKKKAQPPATFFVLHEEIQSDEGDIKIVFNSDSDGTNYELDSYGFSAGLDLAASNNNEPNDAADNNSGILLADEAILAVGNGANSFTDSFSNRDVEIHSVFIHCPQAG